MSEELTQRSDVRQGAGDLRRQFVALVAFGISFGFVETAVVHYLRFVWQPLHARHFPESAPDSLFPLLALDQLRAEGAEHVQILYTELMREAATLVMLASAGLAIGCNPRQWFAGFMIAFGVWDIFYYVFLKLLLDWPESLATWDLLFLLPVPWVGPVWAPMLVSVAMILAGIIVLWRESIGRPVRINWAHAALIAAGSLTIIVAFCWDWRNIVAGGEPNPFQWPLFTGGLAVGLFSFLHAARTDRGAMSETRHPRNQVNRLEAAEA